MMKMISKSNKETKSFAKKLAQNILRTSYVVRRTALVISLEGDLGAGKTTFTKGFAEGLGIKEKIQSPTFVILKIYSVKQAASSKWQAAKTKQLIHIDAYRLQAKDFKVLGWKEFLNPPAGGPENIILVEWGNKIKKILPKNTVRIIFGHGKNSKERIISIL